MRRRRPHLTAALALFLVLSAAPEAWATDDSETELAKKTQNPVADLISVPFQSNFNFNTSLAGYDNADRPKDASQG